VIDRPAIALSSAEDRFVKLKNQVESEVEGIYVAGLSMGGEGYAGLAQRFGLVQRDIFG